MAVESGVMNPELVTRRYVGLINQLGDSVARQYGWKSAVARKLGVDKGYISLLTRDPPSTQHVGGDALQRACDGLGLPMSYFTDPSLGDDPPYQKHTSAEVDLRIGPPKASGPDSLDRHIGRYRKELARVDAALSSGVDQETESTKFHYLTDQRRWLRDKLDELSGVEFARTQPQPVGVDAGGKAESVWFQQASALARSLVERMDSGWSPNRHAALTLAYAVLAHPAVAAALDVIEAERTQPGGRWEDSLSSLLYELEKQARENKS